MGSEPGMPSVRTFVNDFVKTKLDNYLQESSERCCEKFFKLKENVKSSGIRKLATDRAKKANLHNKKLRDCASSGY
jgi:topoisomerase-4 subunit B